MSRLIPAGTRFEHYRHVRIPADEPPPPSPEELELDREMEYFVEPEEAFTRDEIEQRFVAARDRQTLKGAMVERPSPLFVVRFRFGQRHLCWGSPSAVSAMASVLIIDDHEGTLQTYSTVLRLSRFDAATAATGKAGIELAQRRAFDVHLVDRRLPDMDGIDVLRELKLNHVTGRIVVVTAFPTLESSFDAAQVGADGYVDGPLFGEEIVEVVTQAMTGPYPVHLPTEIRSRNQVTDQKRPAEPASAIDPRVREAMRMIDADLAKPWSVPNSRAASI